MFKRILSLLMVLTLLLGCVSFAQAEGENAPALALKAASKLVARGRQVKLSFFEDEADAATTKMTAALEPIMLILMAILVGTTVGAIAMPIFTMAQFVG